MQNKREILQKALENINHPLSEITRRTTYRGHSPGVKPTTGIKLNLPKTSTMAAKMEKVLADKSPEGRKRMKQMNNLVIGREEDGDKISLEFKTTASRERFRKMMNSLSENVQLDEMKKSDGPFTVVAIKNNKVVGQLRSIQHDEIEDAIQSMKADYKGAKVSVESKSGKIVHTEDVELDEATQHIVHVNVSRTGFRKLEVMIASLNGYRESDYSDGKARFYFDAKKHDSAERKKVAEFIKKTRGAEFSHTIKEDVQVNEMSPFNVMGGKKTATPRKMGRDLENRLKMTKPSEYSFSAPAAGGGTFAVIPVNMERPSMLSQAGVMMATFDKRGKVLAYYGTHMDTDSAKKFAKKEGLIESVQLDEGSEIVFSFDNPMKAGAFASRIMRDKLASEVDRYVSGRKEMVQVIMHPNDYERNDIEKLAKQYKGQLREDLQLDEAEEVIVNFRFDNRSDAIAFGHQAKKQGLALRANEFESQGKQTSQLAVDGDKLISLYFDYGSKLKKLAKKYMGKYSTTDGDKKIDKMMREDVQLNENVQNQVKRMDRRAKEKLAKTLNDLDLSGYGDYEARIDNVHKFKPSDLKMAMEMMSESFSMSLDEKQKMTYVIDRKTKKIVLGPTGVADAKRYLEKQIQPRKFMIRDIRGAAKKVGDIV